MRLQSVEFVEDRGRPQEWTLEGCTLEKINLIVGQNASGKSRTLNIIASLAKLLSGDTKAHGCDEWTIVFDKDGERLRYELHIRDSQIIHEVFKIGDSTLLERGANGRGKIRAEKIGCDIDFEIHKTELGVVAKRDLIQHPFLEDLHKWGKMLRHYHFGTHLGKDHFATFIKAERETTIDPKDTNAVVALFRKAKQDYGEAFGAGIKEDMSAIQYAIDNVDIGPPRSIVVQGGPPIEGLLVKESDLPGTTDQQAMSQGMFRALALLIHLAYSERSDTPSCILIDDIGEGLDYARSSALIKLLIAKAEKSPVQLVMATNDRFVMNAVPLKYWGVIQRFSNKSKIFNNRNVRENSKLLKQLV